MFSQKKVQEALRKTLDENIIQGRAQDNRVGGQDSVISMLIHDIFGGEILKTSNKKGWHFYNRIDGQRIDFSKSKTNKSSGVYQFEDIPATTEETNNYFVQEEYANFFIKFVVAFEETVGLNKQQPSLSA